jgi:hypothetical protein
MPEAWLCGKILRLEHIVKVITSVCNIICFWLCHKHFDTYLYNVDIDYEDFPCYTEMHWLFCLDMKQDFGNTKYESENLDV